MTLGQKHQPIAAAVVSATFATAAVAEDFTVSTAETVTNAGIGYDDHDTMTITSTGSIQVTVFDAVSNEVDYFTLTNNGTLSATNAVAPTFPLGGPVAFSGVSFLGTNNTIINNNIISSSHFDGVNVVGPNTTVTNNGTITAGIDGIAVNGANSRITNTGTITTTADGIYLFGDGAIVVNSGTITANDDGIDTSGDNDVITNTGTITAVRDAIETSGAGVVVTTSGVVVGGSDSFDLNGDNSTLNLIFGSRTEGLMSFDGANSTLNIGAGFNAAFTTDGGNPTTITSARNAYLQDGNTIFALNLDQSFNGMAQAANTATSLHTTAQGQSRAGRNDVATQGLTPTGFGPWVQLSTDFALGLKSSNSAGYTTRGAQITAGLALSDGLGVFAGVNDARAKKANSFETDSETVVAGLYGTFDLNGADLNWTIATGRTGNAAQRHIQNNTIAGGWETATSSYDQSFVAPSVSYARRLQPGLMMDLSLGYVGLRTDGYSETGATNNATFAARTSHVASLTPKLSWTTLDSPIPFDMSAGVQLRKYWGDPVNVTIGAANGSFSDHDSALEARAFVSGRVEYPLGDAWLLTGFGEAGISSYRSVNLSADFLISRDF
ncbi:hypothetical protein [Cognatishimia sp.]|uniref:hypothetical protein n=1 Tax=Cognatishimia sp. TaxID=2211648 RepID=UPI003515FECC